MGEYKLCNFVTKLCDWVWNDGDNDAAADDDDGEGDGNNDDDEEHNQRDNDNDGEEANHYNDDDVEKDNHENDDDIWLRSLPTWPGFRFPQNSQFSF